MNLVFHIETLQLLIFFINGQEFVANLDDVLLCFPLQHSVEPVDCILLSSFELKAIFLISSVKTLCLSLLSLHYIFDIDSLFFINSI